MTGFAIETRQLLASFSALGNERKTPIALIRRGMTFWKTRDVVISSQPSAIQAMDATMNIMKPATVIRAFTLAATRAAARTVVAAAKVLRIESSFH